MGEVLGGEDGGVLAGFAAGSRVARYLLEEQVGAGGQAVVFRARDERLRRLVALKVLGAGLAADEEFRRRFIRESRAAAAVEDPHIIPVHEAGEASGVLFIAMRYVPGGDVRTLLRRAGPLPPSQAAAIISPVASALDSAHAAGLVHRDVKPANMLLDVRPGRPDHVYLSDFGLSKGVLSLGLTGSGHFLGTPGYSAPEQIQGRPVDGRADQYALACTAFELLCGAAVFPRDEVLAVMYAHLSEPPPRLTARRPGTPAAADAVFTRTLAKEPADRYASCREFADALRGAFGLPPYHAAQETGPQLDHPPARITDHGVPAGSWPATQHRARHAQAGDGQTGPSGLSTFPPSQAQRKKLAAAHEDSEAKAADRRRGITRRAVLGLAAAGAAAGLAVTGWDLSHRTTAPPHPPTRRPSGGTPIWNTTIPKNSSNHALELPTVQAVVGGIVYVSNVFEQYALRASDGAKLWSSSSLTYAGSAGKGMVYATGADGLYAVRAIDGQQLWHFKLQYPFVGAQDGYGMAVDGNIIYTADQQGVVYGVRAENGNELWSFPTRQGSLGIAAAGGIAYFCGWSSSVYAIRVGREVWRSPVRTSAYSLGPVVAGRLVYVSGDTKLYAFHATNGAEEWEFPLNDSRLSAVSNSSVYLSSFKGAVYALTVDGGERLWRFEGGWNEFPSMTTESDTVYVGSDVAVYAIHAKSGKEMWRFATNNPGPGSFTQVTLAGDTLYAADNNLHALRVADGKERWNFPVEVSPALYPRSGSARTGVTAAGGVAYFAGTNYQVYAVHT